MKEISIPTKLEPIVQAFFAESPQVAKKLVIKAVEAIYGAERERKEYDFTTRFRPITDEQIEEVCALMHGIKPIDVLEALIGAQVIVSHLLGMRKLANGCDEDQRLGLKMLQFSSESIARLQKKRCGGMQNITINYNHNGNKLPPVPVIPIENYSDFSD